MKQEKGNVIKMNAAVAGELETDNHPSLRGYIERYKVAEKQGTVCAVMAGFLLLQAHDEYGVSRGGENNPYGCKGKPTTTLSESNGHCVRLIQKGSDDVDFYACYSFDYGIDERTMRRWMSLSKRVCEALPYICVDLDMMLGNIENPDFAKRVENELLEVLGDVSQRAIMSGAWTLGDEEDDYDRYREMAVLPEDRQRIEYIIAIHKGMDRDLADMAQTALDKIVNQRVTIARAYAGIVGEAKRRADEKNGASNNGRKDTDHYQNMKRGVIKIANSAPKFYALRQEEQMKLVSEFVNATLTLPEPFRVALAMALKNGAMG